MKNLACYWVIYSDIKAYIRFTGLQLVGNLSLYRLNLRFKSTCKVLFWCSGREANISYIYSGIITLHFMITYSCTFQKYLVKLSLYINIPLDWQLEICRIIIITCASSKRSMMNEFYSNFIKFCCTKLIIFIMIISYVNTSWRLAQFIL